MPTPRSIRSLGGLLVDQLNKPLEVLDRRVGEDPVAQVEDVPGTSSRSPEDVPRPLSDDRPPRQRRGRIEGPPDRPVVADRLPRLVQREPVVDPDRVAPRLPHQVEQMRGPPPEMDRRDP